MLNIKLTLTLLTIFIPSVSSAASFDCVKANSKVEKLICSDNTLSHLDEELNRSYKRVMKNTEDKHVIKTWQREWLKSEIETCLNVKCLVDSFSSRIQLLNEIAPAAEKSARWNGYYVRYINNKKDMDPSSIYIIGMSKDRIHATGWSQWSSGETDGMVNIGQINAVGSLKENKAKFDDEDSCGARMKLIGDVLLVEDETGCGGLNVTFNGEYRRSK